jgi:hypothetical protein
MFFHNDELQTNEHHRYVPCDTYINTFTTVLKNIHLIVLRPGYGSDSVINTYCAYKELNSPPDLSVSKGKMEHIHSNRIGYFNEEIYIQNYYVFLTSSIVRYSRN